MNRQFWQLKTNNRWSDDCLCTKMQKKSFVRQESLSSSEKSKHIFSACCCFLVLDFFTHFRTIFQRFSRDYLGREGGREDFHANSNFHQMKKKQMQAKDTLVVLSAAHDKRDMQRLFRDWWLVVKTSVTHCKSPN